MSSPTTCKRIPRNRSRKINSIGCRLKSEKWNFQILGKKNENEIKINE